MSSEKLAKTLQEFIERELGAKTKYIEPTWENRFVPGIIVIFPDGTRQNIFFGNTEKNSLVVD